MLKNPKDEFIHSDHSRDTIKEIDHQLTCETEDTKNSIVIIKRSNKEDNRYMPNLFIDNY